MRKEIFISAGEASGDLHAAGLLSELRTLQPDISAWGLGGSRMRSQGAETHYDISELAAMGFAEVVRKLPFFRAVFKTVTDRFDEDAPDAAILVDYPGMNFRLADRLNRLKIPFVYYILPQVWAWHRSRVNTMRRWNAKFVSILPFEPEFFSRYGLDIEYHGHPLVDSAKPDIEPAEFRSSLGIADDEKLIAVLAGSRLQEIDLILPRVLSSLRLVQDRFRDLKIVCRPADPAGHDRISQIIGDLGVKAEIYCGNVCNLLSAAALTLVTSGTATVEAAICRSPAVVLYRTNWLTYLIAKRLVRVRNIAMANIIAGEKLYPELIQSDVNSERIAREVTRILEDPEISSTMKTRAGVVLAKLGEGGAYRKAAQAVRTYLFG